ncbi:MAG: hypothetical protein R3E79_47945 [Caldilineaceae bacterium]
MRRLLYMGARISAATIRLRTFYRRLPTAVKQKVALLPLLANSWFGLGLFLANLNGILISTHLGLDKYERISGPRHSAPEKSQGFEQLTLF